MKFFTEPFLFYYGHIDTVEHCTVLWNCAETKLWVNICLNEWQHQTHLSKSNFVVVLPKMV